MAVAMEKFMYVEKVFKLVLCRIIFAMRACVTVS